MLIFEQSKFMLILGLDPGTAITGFGLIKYENKKYEYITCGVISTTKGSPDEERLLIVANDLAALLKKYKPDLVGIEDLYFFKNLKTAVKVAQSRGVLMLECARFGVQLKSLTPLQVKQSVATYGRADKKQVGEMVKRILNLTKVPKPDDAADALAVAIATSMFV